MGTDTDERLRALAQRAVQSVEDWLGIELTDEQRRQGARTLGVRYGGAGAPGAEADVEVAKREELQEAYDRAASEVACLTDPQVVPGDPEHLLLCSRDEIPTRLRRARAIAALIVAAERETDYASEHVSDAAEQIEHLLDAALKWQEAVDAALAAL